MKTIKLAVIFLTLLFFMNNTTSHAAGTVQIAYTVTFPEAQAHYADVEMHISGLNQAVLDLKMPVWTPGSYLVREFAKNIEAFSASSGNKMLAAPKITKNCWRKSYHTHRRIKCRYR